MKSMTRVGVLLTLLLVALLASFAGRPATREAEAQSGAGSAGGFSPYNDSRYFTCQTTSTTAISQIVTANYTAGVATAPLTVNHVLHGGFISCGTAGTVSFYNTSAVSAASFVFSITVPANTATPLTDAMIQKGIPFGLGNPIYAIGPAATTCALWVRDDPK